MTVDRSDADRLGLEGLPVSDAEVVGFDLARRSMHASELGILVAVWLLVLGTAAAAIGARDPSWAF